GMIPPVGEDGIDTRGLNVSEEEMAELLDVDAEEWKAQLPQFQLHYGRFDHLPDELNAQLKALEERLS
ncbi:MAG TPA: phosphoenolpyruvate carboxykinase domain-containing protein, partial [Methylomirabilota bacterium]